MGVGSQDDFEYAQDFINDTGVDEIEMLWERSGTIWRMNNVMSNSSLQLFSHDLTNQSGLIWFNDEGRSVVLDAAIQEPWAPADSPFVTG